MTQIKPCWLTHPGVRRRWRWRRRVGEIEAGIKTRVHKVVNVKMAKPRDCTTHAVTRLYPTEMWRGQRSEVQRVRKTWWGSWRALQLSFQNCPLLLIKRTASVFLSLPTSVQTLCSLLILSCIWAHGVKLIYFTQDEARTFWNHVL